MAKRSGSHNGSTVAYGKGMCSPSKKPSVVVGGKGGKLPVGMTGKKK